MVWLYKSDTDPDTDQNEKWEPDPSQIVSYLYVTKNEKSANYVMEGKDSAATLTKSFDVAEL